MFRILKPNLHRLAFNRYSVASKADQHLIHSPLHYFLQVARFFGVKDTEIKGGHFPAVFSQG